MPIKRGQPVVIKVNVSGTTATPSNSTVKMVASGTFTPGGDLGNSTGSYSQEFLSIPRMHAIKQVSFIFTPASNLKPGEYSLMLGAQNSEVGILKAVKLLLASSGKDSLP
jgi:hypothetical protein